MAYFSSGSEGADYEDRYCRRCVHGDIPDEKGGCPVMLAHMLFNYQECNNPDSILDVLIPRSAEGWNEQCTMFIPKAEVAR